MTTDKQINRRLNLSQREIAMAQQVRQQSAQNTISLKLHLPDCTSAAVKEAADQVLDSADIFAVSLCCGEEWQMQYGEAKKSTCMLKEEMSLKQAQSWMAVLDRQPLKIEQQLYHAAVIPLSEGGAVLYVCFHHILIDGYGMSLFVQRVFDVLGGKEIGTSCFAGQEQEEDEKESSKQEAFWRDYFAEADFEPAVFAEKTAKTTFGSRSLHLPDELMDAIEAFGKREQISVPYIVAAAYAFYLAQATGKPDAVFLMPRLNRVPAQREVLGCYTLLVPVRVRVAGAETFTALCREVRRASREASVHKETGFDRILAILREEGVGSESLSEYVFNFYRFQYQTDLAYDVSFSVAGDMSNHLTFSLFYDAKGGLNIRLDYHEGVYTEEKTGYFADAILAVLSEGTKAASADSSLKELPNIGEAERKKVTAIRGKHYPVGTELTISSLFRRAANCYKNRPAVYAGERVLTFAELDVLSDRIACALVKRGIGAGDFVAFMLRRDYLLIPTILGISKSGAAFIPVDPAYPADRISYIMENSHAACLISSPEVAGDGSYASSYVDIHALVAEEVTELPEICQEKPAYMIYTSGTTGRPKGVILSHRGIANIVHPDNNPFNRDIMKNCHGIVAIGSICFDISLFEIFVPLMNGLFVELGSEKAMIDAGELAAHIERHHADILHCTPSRITAYLANKKFSEALGGVQAILAAGEVLPGSLVKRLASAYGIRIYNGYGPTETTIGATITEAGDDVSIGMPIANTGILLLNQEHRLMPFGASGEICVYGDGVGIGYQDRPEETASKYLLWNGIRLYRTGDLGYFSEDGRLIYRGRNDRQVKLRGLRIELSEIENVMGEFPGVSACSCVIRKLDKTEHLVGFYTVSEQASVDAGKLKEHMKSRLTAYMVPDVLKELDVMPQTPNGKTDQKALLSEPIAYKRVYRQPSTERERLVCGAFAETLALDQVGLDDNFFELGGDSLSAVSLLLRVEEALKLEPNELEFGDLYQYPTPSLLTEHLFKKTQEQDKADGYDISALDYQGFSEYLDRHTGGSVNSGFLGNVLITGVTGYLGVHLLIDLLRRPNLCGRIICLARHKRTLSAKRRVKSTLFYYAEEDFSQSYGEKWEVVEGDITDPDIFSQECNVPIHTIINSAANVAHFSYGNALEQINTEGVKNLIRFALRERAALCQISTISVAGVTDGNVAKTSFGEGDFYIRQELHSKYIYSKYMAEYALLRAAVDEGLRVRLMRVGNLQGRISDGEFQMNMHSNAFTRQLASYVKIGAVPESVYRGSVNFSPVDETAHNIISLSAICEDAVAFHVYPPDEVRFADLFRGIEGLGYAIKILPDEEFAELLWKLKRTSEGREQMEGLFTRELAGAYRDIPVSQEITNQYLQALSEGWSTVTEAYINKYLYALDSLDYF